jgi:hypothetical protein
MSERFEGGMEVFLCLKFILLKEKNIMSLENLKNDLKRDFGPLINKIRFQNRTVKNFLILWTAIHVLIFAFSFNSKSRLRDEESKAKIEQVFYPVISTYSIDEDGYLRDSLPGKTFVLETYDFTELLVYVGFIWLIVFLIDSNKSKR